MADLSPMRIAEYSALREEIQRKVDTQFQVVSLTLLVAGTALSLGLQGSANTMILLIYPIVATLLATEWIHKSNAILLIAKYIRETYENEESGLQWETYAQKQRKGAFSLTVFAALGVFLGTQLLAVGLAVNHLTFQPQEMILLGIDALCGVSTLVMMGFHRQK